MSLYLGTGSNGKVMHITKDSHDATTMQGGILPDTVFHSDLPYITWKEIPCTRTDSAGLPNSLAAITISSADASLISLNNYSWFFVCDGTMYSIHAIDHYENGVANPGQYGYGVWSVAGSNDSISAFPFDTYCTFSFNAAYTSIRLFILNISGTSYVPVQTTSNDIVVSPGNISVKGVDLTDLKYLRRLQINNTDFIANTGSTTLQFIDGAGMTRTTIKSDSTKTTIGDGVYTLFDSSVGGNFVYRGAVKTLTLPLAWNVNASYTLSYTDYQGKYAVIRMHGAGNGLASYTFFVSLDYHAQTAISIYNRVWYEFYNNRVYAYTGYARMYLSVSAGVITITKTYTHGSYSTNIAYPELLVTSYMIS